MTPPPSHLTPSVSSHNLTTAHFQFQCSSDRPLVVATISVSFREILVVAPSPSSPMHLSNEPGPSEIVKPPQAPTRHNSGTVGEGNSSHLKDTCKQEGGSGGVATATQRGPLLANDDEYWCPIVEKSPSADYGV